MHPLLEYVRRAAWIVLGLLSVTIGAIGIVVPGLPTTVFFIIAAACFARSHPRLEQWVLDLPRIGPAVRRYRAGLGMPLRSKYWAIGMIVVFTSISMAQVALGGVRLDDRDRRGGRGVGNVARRVPTTPPEALEPVGSG